MFCGNDAAGAIVPSTLIAFTSSAQLFLVPNMCLNRNIIQHNTVYDIKGRQGYTDNHNYIAPSRQRFEPLESTQLIPTPNEGFVSAN